MTMAENELLDIERRPLGDRDNVTFVEREEFFRLLLSTRKLTRADEPAKSVRGLLDETTGARFLIEVDSLFAPVGKRQAPARGK
jgi:hypothetical protein